MVSIYISTNRNVIYYHYQKRQLHQSIILLKCVCSSIVLSSKSSLYIKISLVATCCRPNRALCPPVEHLLKYPVTTQKFVIAPLLILTLHPLDPSTSLSPLAPPLRHFVQCRPSIVAPYRAYLLDLYHASMRTISHGLN